MPQRGRDALLWDIADSCGAVTGFVSGQTLQDFREDRMLFRAVERELSIVGEAVSQLSRLWPETDLPRDLLRSAAAVWPRRSIGMMLVENSGTFAGLCVTCCWVAGRVGVENLLCERHWAQVVQGLPGNCLLKQRSLPRPEHC